MNTNDYRNAPSYWGPKAFQWLDKPHSLVYELCNEVDRLRKELADAKELIEFKDTSMLKLRTAAKEYFDWNQAEYQGNARLTQNLRELL